jgi:hypothetical protein
MPESGYLNARNLIANIVTEPTATMLGVVYARNVKTGSLGSNTARPHCEEIPYQFVTIQNVEVVRDTRLRQTMMMSEIRSNRNLKKRSDTVRFARHKQSFGAL